MQEWLWNQAESGGGKELKKHIRESLKSFQETLSIKPKGAVSEALKESEKNNGN